jgi:hypothetical protein
LREVLCSCIDVPICLTSSCGYPIAISRKLDENHLVTGDS